MIPIMLEAVPWQLQAIVFSAIFFVMLVGAIWWAVDMLKGKP